MPIINQPFQGQLGNILISELSNDYSMFTIFSAFAKNSGVLRLKDALTKFRENGGKVKAFIGIDLDGTSYEALLNLFSLCDELYVIHSESFSTTYHSKIYLLENTSKAFCAVGSNNLTGGGLWTNFESCNIENYSLPNDKDNLENIYSIENKYSDVDYPCSARINSIDDINTLLDANYISKEVTQRIDSISKRVSHKNRRRESDNTLFGHENVSIPAIISVTKSHIPITKPAKVGIDQTVEMHVQSPSFSNEQFWFEMRKSTGGSSNILDLSKLGKISSGSVIGTPYEYDNDSNYMYGGVKFFDINPDNTSYEKNITINYLGKDYYPSTIKFAPDNGSWRIQLKGKPSDGTEELSKYGKHGDFINKILIFEKINTDYYVLSLLDNSELERLKSLSRVWAHNGNNTSSRAYGML